jgi:hypothetical protein
MIGREKGQKHQPIRVAKWVIRDRSNWSRLSFDVRFDRESDLIVARTHNDAPRTDLMRISACELPARDRKRDASGSSP